MLFIGKKKKTDIDEKLKETMCELQTAVTLLNTVIDGNAGPFKESQTMLARSSVFKARFLLKDILKKF